MHSNSCVALISSLVLLYPNARFATLYVCETTLLRKEETDVMLQRQWHKTLCSLSCVLHMSHAHCLYSHLSPSCYQSLRLRQRKAVRRKIQWLFLTKIEGLSERGMLKERRRMKERDRARTEERENIKADHFKVTLWLYKLRWLVENSSSTENFWFCAYRWVVAKGKKRNRGGSEWAGPYHKEPHLVLHHAHTAPQLSSSFTLFLHQSW